MRNPSTIRVVTNKWNGEAHWEFDTVPLGIDDHGQWLGVPEGTWISRPGVGFGAHCDQVFVVPHEEWWVATFYFDWPKRPFDVYVDICTPPDCDDHEVNLVDLDLDVIRGVHGRVWIDDEDEFAEHKDAWNYPATVVEQAVKAAENVRRQLEGGRGIFEPTLAREWLARLVQRP